RSFWVKPVAALFYGVFAVAALWYAPRHIEAKLAKFEPPPPPPVAQDMDGWWDGGWRRQPARRAEFDDELRWPLDVQVAGPLAPLRQRLEAQGWRVQPQARWEQALNLLDTDATPEQVPVLPATLEARTEALLMVRESSVPGRRYALRLWPSAVRLEPGQVPLWIGTAQTLHYTVSFNLIASWRPQRDADPALAHVLDAVDDLPHAVQAHPET